jgi:hypothetical protein
VNLRPEKPVFLAFTTGIIGIVDKGNIFIKDWASVSILTLSRTASD